MPCSVTIMTDRAFKNSARHTTHRGWGEADGRWGGGFTLRFCPAAVFPLPKTSGAEAQLVIFWGKCAFVCPRESPCKPQIGGLQWFFCCGSMRLLQSSKGGGLTARAPVESISVFSLSTLFYNPFLCQVSLQWVLFHWLTIFCGGLKDSS